jgi:hypothetical protein
MMLIMHIARRCSSLLIVVAALGFSACHESPKVNAAALGPTKVERIATVSQMLEARLKPLPSALDDAHFVELRQGSGGGLFSLGPSDYHAYLVLKLPPGSMQAWRAQLKPLIAAPGYVAPEGAAVLPAWVSKEDFAALEFFEPQALSFRVDGWIGLSMQRGELFMFTATR